MELYKTIIPKDFVLVSVENREISTARFSSFSEARKAMLEEIAMTKYVERDELFGLNGIPYKSGANHFTGFPYEFGEDYAWINGNDEDLDWFIDGPKNKRGI